MKLVQFGTPGAPDKGEHYYDITSEDCKNQTGYIENKGKVWKMYLSYLYVLSSMQDGRTKYYFYGTFEECVSLLEKLTGSKIEIVDRKDI